jgi:phage terminase large subunit-like protein
MDDGTRLYTEGIIGMARKWSKTTTIAGLALTTLIMEPVPGQIVGTVAKDLGQAQKSLGFGKRMVETNPRLKKLCRIYSDRIYIPDNDSVWRVFPHSADDVQGEGLRVAIFEEPHTYTRQDTIDGVRSGMGAREEPLLLGVTTAGSVRRGALWDWIHGAVDPETKEREGGILRDPRGLYFWYGAGEDEAIDDREAWRKYNAPWITMDYLEDMWRRLTRRDFERYHLNRWPRVGRYSAAIPAADWMSEANCRPPVFDPERPTVMAVDAADKRDRIAVTTVQVDGEGDYHVWCEIREADREREYHDYLALEDTLRTTATDMNAERIAFDRRQMARTMAELEDEGYPVEEFTQDNQRMCAASQFLFELAKTGRLRHGGDPVLAAHIASAAPYERPPLGWRFAKANKDEPNCKIDGAVATAMAVWIAQVKKPPSFASTQGIWVIPSS